MPESGEFAGFLESDTTRAAATGLRCRPVQETVADTWAWLQRDGMPAPRPDRPGHKLPPETEQRLRTTTEKTSPLPPSRSRRLAQLAASRTSSSGIPR